MSRPLVSVIIVNWNGADDLPTCLASLVRQTYSSLEVIIVDNASTDASEEIVARLQVTLPFALGWLPNSKNEGFCKGNNRGIRAAHGEYIFLLNADVILEPRFIEEVLKPMASDAETGITLGKLLNGHNPQLLDSTGILMLRNRRALDRGQRTPDNGQYYAIEEVFGASGAACLYRKAMLDAIAYPGREYLDELFFAYKEDVDLAWRARLAGWKCVYTPHAIGRHFRTWGSGKRADIPKRVRRHSLKNRYLMLLKNEYRQTFVPNIPSMLWYELRSLVYILCCEPYLLASFTDILRAWPEILRKRRAMRPKITQAHLKKLRKWFQ